jgi:hypothetical protein
MLNLKIVQCPFSVVLEAIVLSGMIALCFVDKILNGRSAFLLLSATYFPDLDLITEGAAVEG